MTGASLGSVAGRICACRSCPRLRAWREEVARVKRRAFRDEEYWGRPVPGFGDPRAELFVLGLAPGAHGANRTGRPFTGDGCGDFLFGGLYRAGYSNRERSVSRGDGLKLQGAFLSNAVRCAPPGNRPSSDEVARCRGFLDEELALVRPKVVLALGGIAFCAALEALARAGVEIPRPRPRFGHGAEVSLARAPVLLGSYHVSQLNTRTGRLTPAMFEAVLVRARALSASRAFALTPRRGHC